VMRRLARPCQCPVPVALECPVQLAGEFESLLFAFSFLPLIVPVAKRISGMESLLAARAALPEIILASDQILLMAARGSDHALYPMEKIQILSVLAERSCVIGTL
jgi:hypothetical protein